MTNVNSDNSAESTPTDASTDASSGASTGAAAGGASGLPLRGLAMVLIAVAVMLGMWGLYKLTSEDSSDTASQTGASEAATLPAPAEGEPGAQGGKPGSAAQQAPGESAQASDPAAAGAAGEGKTQQIEMATMEPRARLPSARPKIFRSTSLTTRAARAMQMRNPPSSRTAASRWARWATCLATSSPSRRPWSSTQPVTKTQRLWLARLQPSFMALLPSQKALLQNTQLS